METTTFEKVDVEKKLSRNSYFYDNKIDYYKNQNYIALKSECLKSKKLFKDPLFPSSNQNIYYSKQVPRGIKWKRPHEITKNPKFVENLANIDDLDQGMLGNCWFIAGCAAIALMPDLFKKVVPLNQEFDEKNYAGIFHFRFWIYGVWCDVVVDDYLPVWGDNTLVFCSNKEEPNEFWAALLEKAYAKVCGSYENLEGGFTSDALIDLSGGIEENFELNNTDDQKKRDELWMIICRSRKHNSMNAAYIDPDPLIFEQKLPNGLVKGHAYTIIKVLALEVNNEEIKLIKVRNPWGRTEWTGAWSDKSIEWKKIPQSIKDTIEFKIDSNDGQFWMKFDDFYFNFDSIQFCHLTPDAYSDEVKNYEEINKRSWKMVAYHDEWVKERTAGGSGNNGDKRYWKNPQFLIKLVHVDSNQDNKATLIVSLMQKYTREKRLQNFGQPCEEFIQFRLYKVLNEVYASECAQKNIKLNEHELERAGNSGNYVNKREVTKRFRVEPGYYLIIPSLFDYNVEGQFLLRVFTENPIEDNNMHILVNEQKKSDHLEGNFFKKPEIERGFKSLISVLGHLSIDEPKSDKLEPNEKSQLSVNLASSQSSLSSTSSSLLNEAKDKIHKAIYKEKAALKKKMKEMCILM